MNLSDHLMQRGIKTTSVSGAGHSSKIFRYPMEVCLGYLGMSILSIAILSFVVYSGYNGSVDKKNEEYYWIAAVALFALVMLVFLFQYIKYSQKLYFDKPFLVQKDVFSGIIKLNLLDGAVWKFTADSDLMLKDTKTRMYINTKLINFYSFCTEVETISGLHILKTLHQDQQKKMMMRLKTENHSA
jgi:tellurite resistance protein TehA-like permease